MIFRAVCGAILAAFLMIWSPMAMAAQYAAVVMDARTGKVVHARNANTKLHPASLTKMMTLYVVFEEIRQGRLALDQTVTISAHAAGQPPSKLGLRRGQKITIRNLVRAAAVKSANDAAAALGEAVSGSEAAFARKMTAFARALGMSKTTFKNASGLTATGHLSTASDMALLGRRLFFDFPEYYNLFARRSVSTGVRTVYNTNRRLLNAYDGADGIKTGYTRAAGYNLVASAKRGQERVIVSMFGGKSTASRNAQVAKLMDLGFQRMPSHARVKKPKRLTFLKGTGTPSTRKVLSTKLSKSFRPVPRTFGVPKAADDTQVVARSNQNALSDEIRAAVARVLEEPQEKSTTQSLADLTKAPSIRLLRPVPRPKSLKSASLVPQKTTPAKPLIAKPKTTGSWAVDLGNHASRHAAESHLLRTALQDIEALDGGVRRIDALAHQGRTVYRARFVGLSAQAAENACARLMTRATECRAIAP